MLAVSNDGIHFACLPIHLLCTDLGHVASWQRCVLACLAPAPAQQALDQPIHVPEALCLRAEARGSGLRAACQLLCSGGLGNAYSPPQPCASLQQASCAAATYPQRKSMMYLGRSNITRNASAPSGQLSLHCLDRAAGVRPACCTAALP